MREAREVIRLPLTAFLKGMTGRDLNLKAKLPSSSKIKG
jgi:hypothetical protein